MRTDLDHSKTTRSHDTRSPVALFSSSCQCGSSLTLTVPPEMLDLLKAEQGDELQLVAHMDTGVIEVSKVEDEEG